MAGFSVIFKSEGENMCQLVYLLPNSSRSSMDRMSDSGSDDGGSNPFGNTKATLRWLFCYYLIGIGLGRCFFIAKTTNRSPARPNQLLKTANLIVPQLLYSIEN